MQFVKGLKQSILLFLFFSMCFLLSAPAEAMSSERQPHQQDLSSNVHAADDFNDLFNKVYRTATEVSIFSNLILRFFLFNSAFCS